MDVFDGSDYKALVRERARALRGERPGLTLRHLAGRLPIQYTYLSRALRSETVHLGEDDLFTLCRLLEFSPEEIDFLVLLRARSVAKSPARRDHLDRRLHAVRSARQLSATKQAFASSRLAVEAAYLFDPLAPIVHVALHQADFAANPRRLCAPLGITPKRLEKILRSLVEAEFAEATENGAYRPLRGAIHYGPDHPLTRAHQSLCRSLASARLHQTDEAEKVSFLSTFAADEESFRLIEERFRAFLREAETIARKARPRATYQLAFDLFRWL